MKKAISIIICICCLATSVIPIDKASAASTTQDHGFNIDGNLYDVSWYETSRIKVRQDKGSRDSDFNKNVILGYAEVSLGFATTYKAVDGKIYQRIMLRSKMLPQTVKGDKKGMSQDLVVKVSSSPTLMLNTSIEPSNEIGETSYAISNSISKSLGLDIGYNKASDLTVTGRGSLTSGITTSASYVSKALLVNTNEYDNGYATWDYDYISGSNKTHNNYLYGSSTQYGLLSWNTKNTQYLIGNVTLKLTAKFGGGDSSKNDGRKKTGIIGGSYILGEQSFELSNCCAYKAGVTKYVGK